MFDEELGYLFDDSFREFARQALLKTPEFQLHNNEKYIQDVVYFTLRMCEVLDLDDHPRDIFVTAALLHSICMYDQDDDLALNFDPLHMLHVRGFLSEFQSTIGRDNFNSVMLMIEGQGGFQSPIPQVMPRTEDTAIMWIIPFACALAKGGR